MSIPEANPPGPLKSSWLQRFRCSTQEIPDGGDLQIPLRKLALAEAPPVDHQVQVPVRRILPEKPKGFGSFRVKLASVKFRKPPLPPAQKSHSKAPDDVRPKPHRNFTHELRVHALDVRLERLHHESGARPKDLFAEFASRLDIKEKATPLGTFHIADRKPAKKKVPNVRKEKHLVPGLTPVISPKGSLSFSFPRNSTQPSSRESAIAGSRSFNVSTQWNQSQSARSISTTCCGSSPFPGSLKTSDESTNIICAKVPETCTPADDQEEVQEVRGGKRINDSSDRLVPTTGIKRSRLSVEGKEPQAPEVNLAGPWLNRWKKVVETKKFPDENHSGAKQAAMGAAPSAAAMAIVGSAMRQLQCSSSHPRVDSQELHTGPQN